MNATAASWKYYINCRSAVAYRDVGEGREQDAEASPARLFFVIARFAPGTALLQVYVYSSRRCNKQPEKSGVIKDVQQDGRWQLPGAVLEETEHQ